MRFIHVSDFHLGYQQYGLKDRFDDFSKVFLHIVEQAIEQTVDFLLISGDLFHKRTVSPLAMRVAVAGLNQLKQENIPVIAVEGNHETAYYRDQYSWLDFLDAMGYIQLLNPSFKSGEAILEHHSDSGGAYVDIPNGVRVYGLKYYGASTGRAVESFANALADLDKDGIDYSILMMHAGLEGQLAHAGRLKLDQIAPLKEHIDYLALGHIHKPYDVGEWIYNPGSPETCGMDEVAWPQRGYYLVEIESGRKHSHKAELIAPPRRSFYRFRLEVDNLNSPNQVYDAVSNLVRLKSKELNSNPPPIIELTLAGILPFNRYELELDHITQLVEKGGSTLSIRVQSKIVSSEFEIDVEAEGSRPELEKKVLRELFERDVRFREHSKEWTEGAIELKQLVLDKSDPKAIAKHLQSLQSQLIIDEGK